MIPGEAPIPILREPLQDFPFVSDADESVVLAVRTQELIQEETGVASVVDPLAGSYYVESLTKELGRNILFSREFAELVDTRSEYLGDFEMKGIDAAQAVYALAPG